MLKLDIDFITLGDSSMSGGSFRNIVSIINIFELFKKTALIDTDKICACSDDFKGVRKVHLILR